jgi:phosphatidylglycerol lysyltransferase
MSANRDTPQDDPPRSNPVPVLLALLAFAAAIYAIHGRLDHMSMHQVYGRFAALSWPAVLIAFAGMLASYAMAVLRDGLTLRHLGLARSWRDLAFISFTAQAVGNSLGEAELTGGNVRTRIYGGLGLSEDESAAVSRLVRISLTVGALALSGLGLVFESSAFPVHFGLPDQAAIGIGCVLLALVLWHIGNASLLGPGGWQGVMTRVAVSFADWTAAGLVLFALLPEDTAIGFAAFVPVFALACLAGRPERPAGRHRGVRGGHSPARSGQSGRGAGGQPDRLPRDLLSRAAGAGRNGDEPASSYAGTEPPFRGSDAGQGTSRPCFAPVVFGLLAFASGTYILVAAMTPALAAPLMAAARYLPLPVIELSHFLASIIGLFLLIVANGLSRRLSHAWMVAMGCWLRAACSPSPRAPRWTRPCRS